MPPPVSGGCRLGIEISFLAAIPKGSGMGTSSNLAATILGGLSDFCNLGWETGDGRTEEEKWRREAGDWKKRKGTDMGETISKFEELVV